MLGKILADTVSFVHLLWVAGVVLGPLWGVRSSRWRVWHFVLILVTASLWSFYCPLTVLENSLLQHYDPSRAYGTGFIEHWFAPLIDLRRHGAVVAWCVRGWAAGWGILYVYLWAREASGGSSDGRGGKTKEPPDRRSNSLNTRS